MGVARRTEPLMPHGTGGGGEGAARTQRVSTAGMNGAVWLVRVREPSVTYGASSEKTHSTEE